MVEGSLEVKLPTIWTDEKQSRAEAERRERLEERRSEKRKSQKKEDADARKGAEPAGQMRDEKVHAVVARSTFRSQNVQNTSASDHFWKLTICRKSARRCGAKHISKSKCTKHLSIGLLLEVEMSKKCTPLWCEPHFEVKMLKTLGGSDHFWRLRCRFASLHYTTALHYTTLHSTTLHYITLTRHSTTLQLQLHNYTPLHSTKLHYH